MDLILICYHCQKTIDKNGEIHGGKPYHGCCWNEIKYDKENDDLEDLHESFPKVAPDVLDDLYESYDSESYNSAGRLATDLNRNWCVIADMNEEVSVNTFRTKKEMLDWVVEQIYILMLESYSWDIVYILHKGQVVARDGEIKIKVSI